MLMQPVAVGIETIFLQHWAADYIVVLIHFHTKSISTILLACKPAGQNFTLPVASYWLSNLNRYVETGRYVGR